jgi:hypothetical protein
MRKKISTGDKKNTQRKRNSENTDRRITGKNQVKISFGE